jgi:hypothetical protein
LVRRQPLFEISHGRRAQPTAPMPQVAVKAGCYERPAGANFSKIQILTVKGLLDGIERPRYSD